MNLNNYLTKGVDYSTYLAQVQAKFEELEKEDQDSDMHDYYSLNLKRMERINKTFSLSDEQKEKLKGIEHNFQILAIAEGWCGDAAQLMPVIAKMAEEMKVPFKVVYRDENLELIDAYLTNGARSIPIFVGIDTDGNEQFRFGPRPQHGMDLLAKFKADPEVYTKDEFHKDLQIWYAKDRGNSIFNELYELMNQSK